jgi:hypothetical protein
MAKSNKKLKGGSAVETIGNIVYKGTLIIALIMMMIVPLIFIGLLVCIYFIMNGVLAGTNLVIDISNMAIMPIVSGIITIINGVIRAINSLTG